MFSPIQVTGLDFLEIVEALRPQVETALSMEASGARTITAQALDGILERCDDPDHAREPLAQAVYEFIRARKAKIVVSQ